MKFSDCKCGSNKFNLNMKGKLICQACGAEFKPFGAEHHKVIKPDGFHFFWAVFTPHFIERLMERVPDADIEDVLKVAAHIERKAKRNKFQCTRWRNKHIIWKYRYNERRKRLELEFVSIVPMNKFTAVLDNGFYIKDVQFVEIDFSEELKCEKKKKKIRIKKKK